MMERAQVSPLFEAKLAELALFPIFQQGFIPRSKEHMQTIVQGQANRGEQIGGMVPGTEQNEEAEPYTINNKGDKK